MPTEAILPHVDGNSSARVRYFARDACVDYTGAAVAVYVGGSLLGTFTDEQPVERDVLIAVVCREPRVRMNDVAQAFDLDVKTIFRIRRRYERGGAEAIVSGHRRGRPRRQTQQLEQRLFKLFDNGDSIDKAHGRLDVSVSRSVVARIHKKWGEFRRAERLVEAGGQASVEGGLAFDNFGSATAASDAADAAPAAPTNTASAAPADATSVADAVPPDTTPAGEDDKDNVAATEELSIEEATTEGARQVQHIGTWIMLAMLNGLGLYALAERLREEAVSNQRSAGERSIGKVTLRAALDSVAIALSIGKRCVEGVRWLATPSGPTLLRRRRVMSASWTRRVLAWFASQGNTAIELHWAQLMSLANSAFEGDERAVFYIDNHVRPYTGKYRIRWAWRMQDKKATPGISDYYVHDEEGRPLVRIDDPSNGSLIDWLHPMARLLRDALGGGTKVLMAFDRAGAFAENLTAMRNDGLEFVTYERAPYQLLPDNAFESAPWLEVGRKRVRFVEAARKNLGKGRGRVRRIHLQTTDGTQISVLAVSDATAEYVLTVLLRRWARQENQFKHGNERWGINQLDGRRVDAYPAEEIIPNPTRRRLDRNLRIARTAEAEARRHLAAVDAHDPKSAAYEADLQNALELQRELLALRPEVPTHAPVDETELAGKLMRHPGHYKLVIDSLRVALANVESDLAAWLAPELPNPAEAKKTLAKLLEAPGHVRTNGRTITVTLQPAGAAVELRALDALFLRVNALDLKLPGDPSGRTLRFKQGNK